MAALTFEYLHRKKREKILRERDILITTLLNLPDFYLEIKWDFESSVIPFISKIAPSGKKTLQIPPAENFKNMTSIIFLHHKKIHSNCGSVATASDLITVSLALKA